MTWKWIGMALAGVAGIVLIAHDPQRAQGDAAIAVTVNGTAVSTRELRARAADRPSFARFEAQIVEYEIADQLVRQEAARRRVAPSEAEERELERRMPPAAVLAGQAAALGLEERELTARRRDAMRAQLLLRKLIEQDFPGALEPGDAELRRAFAEAPMVYAEPPAATVRAFLILLPAEAGAGEAAEATRRAERLVAELGAVDSAEAFSRRAAAEGVVPAGTVEGRLGTIALADPFAPPAELPALFGPALSAEVSRALFPGHGEDASRVVGPFRGPQGVFGLFVEHRRGPGPAPSFDQVRDRVRARWIGGALIALAPRLIERLRATATIELNQGATAS